MELQKVLELDKTNFEASSLLSEIRRDRFGREKSFGLKEALWKADSLMAEGKYQEAQVELAALQKEFPEEPEVQQKLQEVNNHLTQATLPGGFPGAGSASDKAQWRDTQLAEATKSLAGDDIPHATLVLTNLKDRFPADPKIEALEKQVEQKKAGKTGQPIRPALRPAVKTDQPKRSVGMVLGGIALVIALGIGGFLYYHHAQPGRATSASPQELQLEHDAKLLQDYGNRDAALAKWRDLAALPGPLQAEAQQAVAQITRQKDIETQEGSLFSQGLDAQQAKKWDDAVGFYQKVVDLNGSMKDQALQAISSVKELQSGADAATLEKEKYDHAMAALDQQDYAQARVLFQQVLDLKVPGSALAAKAQTQLDLVKATQESQKEYAAADKAQSSGDLKGALAEFQEIAAKPGAFQAPAQTRVQQINQLLAANQQKQQAEKALQDILKKFQDMESQKRYGDAAALLPAISQMGGNGSQLKNELESAEQSDLQNLTNQFNQAKSNKDVASLQQLKGQFQAMASASGAPASQARDYAENQIPAAITQINEANQPKPAAPPARATVVTLIVSGTYRPWSRSVQKGMLVPEYNVEGGLKPVSLTVPPLRGAPGGSFVTLKINIDEDGNVSPDIVLLDPSGVGPTVMEAAKRWKFNPPTVRGVPVKTSVAVKVTF